MELPAQEVEPAQTFGVHLDVVGSDAVVIVDAVLLATSMAEDPSRVNRAQNMSTYRSRRFNLSTVPSPAMNILSPAREVALEDDPQVDKILPSLVGIVAITQPTATVGLRTSAG